MSAAEQAEFMERRLADLYGGPLADFVGRRAALAKELRAAGDRDGAAAVKALRKPSRTAWALDAAVAAGPDGIEPLVRAVADTLDAQARDGDVRGAMATLREAVRTLASDAARAAEQAGYAIGAGELGNAVLAVLGRPDSFAQLRGGHLAEIPEGGGLDILATLPVPAAARDAGTAGRVPRAASGAAGGPSQGSSASAERATAAAARRAAKALERARARADTARSAVREAESQLRAAEARVAEAEVQARTARERLERARGEAEAAAAQLAASERAAAAVGSSEQEPQRADDRE